MSQIENDNDDTSESLYNNCDKGEKIVLLEFMSGYPFRQLFEYGSVLLMAEFVINCLNVVIL